MSVVSKFMSNPRQAPWQALKWFLHYLKGSLVRVLVYVGVRWYAKDAPIEGYVDSNYVGCLNTKTSLTGHLLTYKGLSGK